MFGFEESVKANRRRREITKEELGIEQRQNLSVSKLNSLRAQGEPTRLYDRADYYAYIKSDMWRAVRSRYWASNLSKKCQCCGCKATDLHHKTYKNLGRERLMDLIPVCRSCHTKIHDRVKNGAGLWSAHKAVRHDILGGGRTRLGRAIRELKRAKQAEQSYYDPRQPKKKNCNMVQQRRRLGRRTKKAQQKVEKARRVKI